MKLFLVIVVSLAVGVGIGYSVVPQSSLNLQKAVHSGGLTLDK